MRGEPGIAHLFVIVVTVITLVIMFFDRFEKTRIKFLTVAFLIFSLMFFSMRFFENEMDASSRQDYIERQTKLFSVMSRIKENKNEVVFSIDEFRTLTDMGKGIVYTLLIDNGYTNISPSDENTTDIIYSKSSK